MRDETLVIRHHGYSGSRPGIKHPAPTKKIREIYPNVKIIFMSGYAEDKFKDQLGEDVEFLPKPFTLKQLATKVKETLEE